VGAPCVSLHQLAHLKGSGVQFTVALVAPGVPRGVRATRVANCTGASTPSPPGTPIIALCVSLIALGGSLIASSVSLLRCAFSPSVPGVSLITSGV